MLTDDDKKWIAEQIAASGERIGARMEKIETALLTEFDKLISELAHVDAGHHFSRDEINER